MANEMTEEKLPRDGKVLLDWTPPAVDRETKMRDDIADRYLIQEVPSACSGLIGFGMFHGEWHPNPTLRPVVAHLLAELRRLREEIAAKDEGIARITKHYTGFGLPAAPGTGGGT